MRIVHLADADPVSPVLDGALASIATLQQHDPDVEHLLIGIGTGEIREHARRFGARVESVVQSRSALTRSPSNRLRKTIESLGPVDSIQPWSPVTAGLAARLSNLAPMLPPAPGDAPLIVEHVSPSARTRQRERFGLGAHELAVALITDDTSTTVAGTFGLILPPVTCTFQDRTIVGLVPHTIAGDGTTRARRYAESAGEVWRIELIEAPLHAIAVASDAILLPGSTLYESPWVTSSPSLYAARCARQLSIPVICSGFGAAPCKPLLDGAIEPTIPGNVGIAAVLVDALAHRAATDHAAASNENASSAELPDNQQWVARWRQGITSGYAV